MISPTLFDQITIGIAASAGIICALINFYVAFKSDNITRPFRILQGIVSAYIALMYVLAILARSMPSTIYGSQQIRLTFIAIFGLLSGEAIVSQCNPKKQS